MFVSVRKSDFNPVSSISYEIGQKVENYMPIRRYTQKDLANKIGVLFGKMQRYAHTNNIIK